MIGDEETAHRRDTHQIEVFSASVIALAAPVRVSGDL
jgi:hypothetical protein